MRHNLLLLPTLAADLEFLGAVEADCVVGVLNILLVTIGAGLGLCERLVFLVLHLPGYDVLTPLAHLRYVHAVHLQRAAAGVVQGVLEGCLVVVLLLACAVGVSALAAHCGGVVCLLCLMSSLRCFLLRLLLRLSVFSLLLLLLHLFT